MALPLILGVVGLSIAAGLVVGELEKRKQAKMSPQELELYLAARREAERTKENDARIKLYIDAVSGPQNWCLIAMREGRNYDRSWNNHDDLEDIEVWATANHISVTLMERNNDRVRLSFGDLRKARGKARFMGEAP